MKSRWRKLLTLATLLVSNGASQPQDTSARGIINFLNYESDDRRGKPMLASCGITKADRIAAIALARSGQSVLPDIQNELDLVQKLERPESKVGTGWLLEVFARLEGPRAFPRLLKMANTPQMAYWIEALDDSIALSIGLTSYVSGSRPPDTLVSCVRASEPRRALNQLILAWERSDQDNLEASLGPHAMSRLRQLLQGKTWGDLRAKLWQAQLGERTAVGYHFEISHRWAEPEETLDETNEASIPFDHEKPEIPTRFTTSAGKDCGNHGLSFVKTPVDPTRRSKDEQSLPYLIDNSDVDSLLGLIASCAAR